MKKILISFATILLITGCASNIQNDKDSNINNYEESNNSNEVVNSVKVLINNEEYTINLENNEAAESLVKMLPLNLNMSDLNNNEKYAYLENPLPTNPNNPKHINIGDVMLFGDNCLVIFYKSFETPYSYTKIGHIDNLPNLEGGSITAKFI